MRPQLAIPLFPWGKPFFYSACKILGALGASWVVYGSGRHPIPMPLKHNVLGGYPLSNPKPLKSLKFAVFSYKKGNKQHFRQNGLILILHVNIHCGIDFKTSTNIRTVTVTILTKVLSRKKLACVASFSSRVIARKLEREHPTPSPVIPFLFALVPTLSTNSRGNACYAGYKKLSTSFSYLPFLRRLKFETFP